MQYCTLKIFTHTTLCKCGMYISKKLECIKTTTQIKLLCGKKSTLCLSYTMLYGQSSTVSKYGNFLWNQTQHDDHCKCSECSSTDNCDLFITLSIYLPFFVSWQEWCEMPCGLSRYSFTRKATKKDSSQIFRHYSINLPPQDLVNHN